MDNVQYEGDSSSYVSNVRRQATTWIPSATPDVNYEINNSSSKMAKFLMRHGFARTENLATIILIIVGIFFFGMSILVFAGYII
ncbi:MAG: hypothetical protein NTV72_03820 [Candidatus Taylorbacteria bacterium]|nr:hypothetical protein [Candidatus Taylorbacteria bacterium]